MTKRSRPEASLVLVTAPNQTDARAIARALVGDGLAACVNILGPVRSIYRWRGAIEDEAEYLLLIKTRASLYARLERRVRELHSYEVPEVIALGIESGSAPYLKWMLEATGPSLRPAPKRTRTVRSAR